MWNVDLQNKLPEKRLVENEKPWFSRGCRGFEERFRKAPFS